MSLDAPSFMLSVLFLNKINTFEEETFVTAIILIGHQPICKILSAHSSNLLLRIFCYRDADSFDRWFGMLWAGVNSPGDIAP